MPEVNLNFRLHPDRYLDDPSGLWHAGHISEMAKRRIWRSASVSEGTFCERYRTVTTNSTLDHFTNILILFSCSRTFEPTTISALNNQCYPVIIRT